MCVCVCIVQCKVVFVLLLELHNVHFSVFIYALFVTSHARIYKAHFISSLTVELVTFNRTLRHAEGYDFPPLFFIIRTMSLHFTCIDATSIL